jgi:Ca2+/H+ antiporter
MRMILELKRREFDRINYEYAGSFMVIVIFVVIMMFINPEFKTFYLATYFGRSLLIASISIVSIIFSILQYLQSRLDVKERIIRDKEYLE